MKKFALINILGLSFLLGLLVISCDDREDEIDSIDFDRLFSPTGLEARLSKTVDLTLVWNIVKGATDYDIEIYKDSLEFNEANLAHKTQVNTNEFKYTLAGDTRYSARVKSTSEDISESKWSRITFATGINSIFFDPQIGDVSANDITFRWTAGTTATRIVLVPASGSSITHIVTAAEITAGIAKVEGLAASTEYVVTMYADAQRIGRTTLTTLAEGTVFIRPTDDIVNIISTANDNASFLVLPGEYLSAGSVITINKSLSIAGADINDMPIIHAQLEVSPVAALNLSSIILDGTKSDASLLDYAVRFMGTTGSYGEISINNCEIKNYNKSLIAGESSRVVAIESITIDNSIVTNILTNSADGIDMRAGLIRNLKLTNSTFNNVAPARDFIRLDDASGSFPNDTCNVTINQCTFYKVAASKKRIVYVRFTKNIIKVTNNIFAETTGYYSNQSKTSQPECSKNNYFNAPNFLLDSAIDPAAKYDDSDNYTSLDPQFKDASNGNFTVGNSGVRVGDPRWQE